MLIGFFLRRIVTVALCAGSFWFGLKADRLVRPLPAAAHGATCAEMPDGT